MVLEFKNERSHVAKDQNIQGKAGVNQNVFEFHCQNARQTKNHQIHKSVNLNSALHIGIQKNEHPSEQIIR